MSGISHKIKQRLDEARRNREADKVVFYSTLFGEIISIGKSNGNRETTDEEAIRHIRKWVNNLDETIKVRGGASTDLLQEKKLCEEFLPQLMEEHTLRAVIVEILHKVGNKQSDVMRALKADYANQYDGKTASKLYKELTNV